MYSLSLINSIVGYGHSTPRTNGGKLFCIVYALIGIPLNIVMFQSIGERFNIGITIVLKKVKKCIKLKKDQVTQTELTILASFLCTAVLLGGAGAFYYFESWEFTDAFYYCFITMSTIGFGDFVALQNNTMLALQKRPEYVAFSILYILFGLTVFAAALNLMVLRLLTMNTEDERKDELEALAAARGAVKLDGDVITPGTQNTTVGSLGRDVEGMQIEAEDHIRYQPSCIKMQEPHSLSNGTLGNHVSLSRQFEPRRTVVISVPATTDMEYDSDQPMSNGGQRHLCISNNITQETSNSITLPNASILTGEQEGTTDREVVASFETVLGESAPADYKVKKRCSV